MPLHLRKRGGIWHYSRTVPPDVRAVIGAPYWRFTLKTASLREAEALRAEYDAKHQRQIDDVRALKGVDLMRAIRSKPRRDDSLKPHKASRGGTIRHVTTVAVTDAPSPWRVTERRGDSAEARQAYAAAETDALKSARALVSSLSAEERAAIDKAGGVEAFYRAARQDRLKLDIGDAFNPEPRNEDAADLRDVRRKRLHKRERTLDALRLLPDAAPEIPETADNPRLLAALEAWLAKNKQKPPTVVKYRLHVRRFTQYHGNLTIKSVTPAMVTEFVAAYAELPNARPLKLAQRKLPMRDLLALRKLNPDIPAYGDVNTRKMCDYMRSFFRAMKRNDLRDAVEPPKVVRDHDDENGKSFAPDELRRILDTLTQTRGVDADLTWWCYLMAYSGARPEEAAKLHRRDLQIGDEQIAITFTDLGGRKIKNKPSVRTVPTHPVLLSRGFRKFVEARKDMLFPSFVPDTKDDHSNNPSRRLKRLIVQLRIEGDGAAHRFRHTFITAARNSKISYAVELALVGHREKGAHGRYGDRPDFGTLAEAIGLIDPLKPITTLT